MAADAVNRRRRKQAGFTLIEVMVAIVLAAIAASGIIGLYMAVTRGSSYSRHATEASILAEDQMEKLRSGPVPVTGTFTDPRNPLDEKGVRSPANGLFVRSWKVAAQAGYADLEVTVAWTEDGVPRTVIVHSKRNL